MTGFHIMSTSDAKELRLTLCKNGGKHLTRTSTQIKGYLNFRWEANCSKTRLSSENRGISDVTYEQTTNVVFEVL